jgi:flavodoxin I
MRTLVIYDTQFGNTERIAQAVAQALSAYGPSRACLVKGVSTLDLEGVDLVVLGSPTQAWKATDGIRSFLSLIPRESLAGRFAASFDTRLHGPALITGSAARAIARDLRRLRCDVLVPAESFFVAGKEGPLDDGETARAAKWAHQLHDVFAAKNPEQAVKQRIDSESHHVFLA